MRVDFGPRTWSMPFPVLVLGTYDKDGKADAMTAAWGGIYNTNKIIVCIDKGHKTFSNLLERKAITISFATRSTMVASDYIGLVSANDNPDKLQVASLHDIKSEKVDAPLFEEFKLTLECTLDKIIDEESVVFNIVNVNADDSILTDGKPDMAKLDPILYDSFSKSYRVFGENAAMAFSCGNELK